MAIPSSSASSTEFKFLTPQDKKIEHMTWKDSKQQMSNFKNRFYMLEDFIDLVKQKKDRAECFDPNYCYSIYAAASDSCLPLCAGTKIYVGESVQVNNNNQEIYPSSGCDRSCAGSMPFGYL